MKFGRLGAKKFRELKIGNWPAVKLDHLMLTNSLEINPVKKQKVGEEKYYS